VNKRHPWYPYQIFQWERYGDDGVTVFKGYGIMNNKGEIVAECISYNAAEEAAKLLARNFDPNSRHGEHNPR
jgi:hypothetical protein